MAIDWAKICSEIVVALYGTRIVGEEDGWPQCLYPLEECSLGRYGKDPTTLHTYYYGAVPKYHETNGALSTLVSTLWHEKGWAVAWKTQHIRHPIFNREAIEYLAWVNKKPIAPMSWLRKGSIIAHGDTHREAATLAIHKALMGGS